MSEDTNVESPAKALARLHRAEFEPVYAPWRHGGWYVTNVRYPSGAVGCVSRNYPDKKWRIVSDPRPFDKQPTFNTREEAAIAESQLASRASAACLEPSTMLDDPPSASDPNERTSP